MKAKLLINLGVVYFQINGLKTMITKMQTN